MNINITVSLDERIIQFFSQKLGIIELKLDKILDKENDIMAQIDDLNAQLDAVNSALGTLGTSLTQLSTDANKAFADLEAAIKAGGTATDLTVPLQKVATALSSLSGLATSVQALDASAVSADGSIAPVISSLLTANGTNGQPFSYQITASGSPTSFAASNLPAGLTINTATGAISGTPSAAGTSVVGISATNAAGTGSANLTITVS